MIVRWRKSFAGQPQATQYAEKLQRISNPWSEGRRVYCRSGERGWSETSRVGNRESGQGKVLQSLA